MNAGNLNKDGSPSVSTFPRNWRGIHVNLAIVDTELEWKYKAPTEYTTIIRSMLVDYHAWYLCRRIHRYRINQF